MHAGRLRHKVTLQKRTVTGRTNSGEDIVTWTDVATVWAEIAPESGKKVVVSDRETAAVNTIITLRYRSGVTAQMRVVRGAQIWNIQAVIDPTQRHRELQLVCIEQPATAES